MSTLRHWTITAACIFIWYGIQVYSVTTHTYDERNIKIACEERAHQIANPGINDMYGNPITLPLDPQAECDRIDNRMSLHNRQVNDAAMASFIIGCSVILAISGIGFGFRQTRSKIIHEIGTHPRTEIYMGDVFRDIHHSTVINKSALHDAMKNMEVNHPNLLESIADLAKIVEKSGSKSAAELFEQVSMEVAKPVPRKSVLQSCWSALIAALPIIKETASIFNTISGFIKNG